MADHQIGAFQPKPAFSPFSPVRKADLEGPLRVDSAHLPLLASKSLRRKREDQVNRFSKRTEARPPGQARRRSHRLASVPPSIRSR